MENYKPIVLVDMDDVLAEFTEEWLSRYNAEYSDSITAESFDGWDALSCVKPECGEKIFDYFRAPGIYRHLQPKEGSQQVMQWLVNSGVEVLIVTDSPRGTCYTDEGVEHSNPTDDKRAWLQEHFPMIDPDNLIVAKKKWFVQGDVLIDDKPSTVEKFQSLGRDVICMDMPYNQHVNAKLRARTWEEIEYLLTLKGYGL